ncbi:MAG: hypothetical protein ACYS0D_11140 [Planctomycetota bacterium]
MAILVLPIFADRLLSGGDEPQALRPQGNLVTAPFEDSASE